MVLSVATLTAEIRKFTDPDYAEFTGFPETDLDTGIAWANAFDVYTGHGLNIVPPVVVPGAADAAQAALSSLMVGLSIESTTVFDLAFASWATLAAAGMISGAVTAAAPPPLQISLPMSALFLLGTTEPYPTAEVQAGAMAAIMHAWMATGTYVAGGPTLFWGTVAT